MYLFFVMCVCMCVCVYKSFHCTYSVYMHFVRSQF
uniref:Uncharacterized protein n=1 Tax=Anguilla anguilla TaxID=7936 RepID=A0A0E9W517_ANGAN